MQDNTKVKLTDKGLSYTGRSNTDNDTAAQWAGIKAVLGEKVGGTATVAQLREGYVKEYGSARGFIGNLKYHIRSKRLSA